MRVLSSPTPALENAKYRRDKNQRSNRGEQQTTDHGASERGVLLAAFAQSKRHGNHAMIIARAVMSTGRKRVKPASMAALTAFACSARRSLANDTMRILLAVATHQLHAVLRRVHELVRLVGAD